MIRFKFIRDHRTEYSVKRMCCVLKVRRSSYYKLKNTQAARRQKVLDDPDSGAHALVNHKRVARIMKTMRI